jgi:hypothetical protein
MHFTTAAIVVAALSVGDVVASPHNHGHNHQLRHKHKKRQE